MLDKVFKQIRTVFTICLSTSILSFIIDVVYTKKHTLAIDNPDLERWTIIITLFGIFASLKFLHPRLKDEEKINREDAIKKYANKYYYRLSILMFIYIFNIVCFHFMGANNFMYLAFITIFTFFLCSPNRVQIENETQISED